jgi:hypothetical protein
MIVYLKNTKERKEWHDHVMKYPEDGVPMEYRVFSKDHIFHPIYYKGLEETKKQMKEAISVPSKQFYEKSNVFTKKIEIK